MGDDDLYLVRGAGAHVVHASHHHPSAADAVERFGRLYRPETTNDRLASDSNRAR